MKQLIGNGKKWSAYVDDIWKRNAEQLVQFTSETSGGLWKITHKSKSFHYFVQFGEEFPTCNCNQYKSSLIPCPHICNAIAANCEYDSIYTLEVLHPRWKLQSHPLFHAAMVSMGLRPNTHDTVTATDFDSYTKIQVPSAKNRKYSCLQQLFAEVCKVACNSDHWFKVMMVRGAQSLNDMRTNVIEQEPARNAEAAAALAPINKSRRLSSGDLVNFAPASQKRKRDLPTSVRTCSVCKQAGHRKGNAICRGLPLLSFTQ